MFSTEALRSRRPAADEAASWRPTLFRAAVPDERAAIEALLRAGVVDRVHDTLRAQLGELVSSREPRRELSGPALEDAVDRHLRDALGDAPPEHYGAWVWYPWSRRLVHVLPEAEFRFVRTDRNRYKITAAEQERLRGCRIGVVGLSVGRSITATLAQEGVGGHFVLADFDTLALSNMNRLRGGVHDLGLSKAVLAARELYELDPYLSVSLFPDGVDADHLDAFLTGEGRLDLLVEECDDLFVKVRLRERARALGIPVVMETTDRGLIDVERFDLEPDRPLFHGLIGDVRAEALRGLPTRDKVPFVLRLLDEPTMAPRIRASLVEIKESISTWPQLASGIALGSALVTDVARRVLLGQTTKSGRFSVDLERLVGDATASAPPVDGPRVEAAAPEALAAPAPPPLVRPPAGRLERAHVEALVGHAVLAPSGGNAQPWRFVFADGVLRCDIDPGVGNGVLDFEGRASCLAVGAAVENATIAARALGFATEVRLRPDAATPTRICDLAFVAADVAPDARLLEAIPRRCTNRRLGPPVPLVAEDAAALGEAARAHGATLHLLTRREDLDAATALITETDRLIFFNERAHAAFVSEFRWTAAEALATRDGIDLATLDVGPADLAGLRILSDPAVVRLLREIGGGGGLGTPSRKAVAAASALALLTVPGEGAAAYFTGGRAVQRVWLEATARGLAVPPLSALPYLAARAEAGGEGLAAAEAEALRRLGRSCAALFGVRPGDTLTFLFRVARVEAPSARALRRPVGEVLTFA